MTASEPLLKGIKVIEIATFVFGPGCGAILSDFGAEVIKVEAPGIGDPMRHVHKSPPFPRLDFAYAWQQDNRNKRSIALDMKSEKGQEVLRKLVREADVLITNFPPRVLERLKIRYEDLAPENDQLIYGQVTGYGETGDDVNTPGFDGTAYWARTGLMDVVRTAEGDPSMPALAMGDHPSAMTLYAAIMTGLYKRMQTGLGGKVSTSLLANGMWAAASNLSGVLAGAKPYRRLNPASPGSALINYYRTRDDRWVSLIVLQEEKHWDNFVKVVERPELLTDPRFAELKERYKNTKALAAIVREVFMTRDCADWRERLRDAGVTFSVVATLEEVVDDPQALLNDMIIDVEGHNSGRGQAVNSPFWVEGADKVPAQLGADLGADGPEILREIGYDDATVKDLCEQGVVVPAA